MAADTKDVLMIAKVMNQIVLDILLTKKLIDYSDIQNAIAVVREGIPEQHYTPPMRDVLNIMEQTFQAGRYQSPLNRQGEP